jgi:hypothetical protein
MAEFADRDDPTELYTAIEKAYCEDRWPDVIERGGRLLGELGDGDRGLRQRLQLLMAHAYLYGYGDRDSAEDLYRAVHESQAEVALRQIAAHGLEQCDLPHQRPAGVDASPSPSPTSPKADSPEASIPASEPASEPDDQPPPRIHPNPAELPQPAAAPSLEGGSGTSLRESLQALIPDLPAEEAPALEAAPAMPWLASLREASPAAEASPPRQGAETSPQSGAAPAPTPGVDLPWARPSAIAAARESLIPEVIDEPELIEVHQADPALAEEFELRESQRRQERAETRPGAAAAADELPTRRAELEEPPSKPAQAQSVREEIQREATTPPIEEDPDLLRGLLRVDLF